MKRSFRLPPPALHVRTDDLHGFRRVIAVSDPHGDLDGFQGLLAKLGFGAEDALIIVGDLFNRGTQSLPLLRRVMAMQAQGNVFTLLGNNDILLLDWFRGAFHDGLLCDYMHAENSIFTEIAEELHLPWDVPDDMGPLQEAAWQKLQPEIRFLGGMTTILDTPLATFVHAGLQPGRLEEQELRYCLDAPAFADRCEHHYDKLVVTGHWPASNYRTDAINVDPYWNRQTNVVGIDGGNSIKIWGQLNALVWEVEATEPYLVRYDRLPRIRALAAQAENEDAVTMLFPNTKVEIRTAGPAHSVCWNAYLDRELRLPNESLYFYKGETYCSDYTTWHMPVQEGEELTLCEKRAEGLLVKRDGIVGLYCGPYQEEGL